jgi:predicted secreted protein
MEEGVYLYKGIKVVVVGVKDSFSCYVLDHVTFSDWFKTEFMNNLKEGKSDIKKLGELSDLVSF